jgi:hypothetical protein
MIARCQILLKLIELRIQVVIHLLKIKGFPHYLWIFKFLVLLQWSKFLKFSAFWDQGRLRLKFKWHNIIKLIVFVIFYLELLISTKKMVSNLLVIYLKLWSFLYWNSWSLNFFHGQWRWHKANLSRRKIFKIFMRSRRQPHGYFPRFYFWT